jgi:hypothetical protein
MFNKNLYIWYTLLLLNYFIVLSKNICVSSLKISDCAKMCRSKLVVKYIICRIVHLLVLLEFDMREFYYNFWITWTC